MIGPGFAAAVAAKDFAVILIIILAVGGAFGAFISGIIWWLS